MNDVWVWIRVPFKALGRAIDALKDSVSRTHMEASQTDDPEKRARLRTVADTDDAAAESLRKAVRDDELPPSSMGGT